MKRALWSLAIAPAMLPIAILDAAVGVGVRIMYGKRCRR